MVRTSAYESEGDTVHPVTRVFPGILLEDRVVVLDQHIQIPWEARGDSPKQPRSLFVERAN